MEKNCHVEPIYKSSPVDQLRKADVATLMIRGMGCENCATRVRNSLLLLDEVYGVDVYFQMGLAEVRYNSQKIAASELVDAVARAGNDGHHQYRAELVASE
jgi:copper chaperone CopZ